jgi:hypothetical protein
MEIGDVGNIANAGGTTDCVDNAADQAAGVQVLASGAKAADHRLKVAPAGPRVERYRPFARAPRVPAPRLARRAGRLKAPGHTRAELLTIVDLQRSERCANATSAVRFAPAFLTQLSLADAGRGGKYHG